MSDAPLSPGQPSSVQWKILDEHIYERFKIFEARRSTRVNPRTGKPFSFFLMKGLDWVNIIALTEQNEVVLVRQYRHGAEAVTLELPGGCVEAGEDPAVSALRELREETGYEGSSAELIGVVHANPAMQSMKCYTYLARNVRQTASTQLDPGEDITVDRKPLGDALDLVRSGAISHALVVAAFGHYLLAERAGGCESRKDG